MSQEIDILVSNDSKKEQKAFEMDHSTIKLDIKQNTNQVSKIIVSYILRIFSALVQIVKFCEV